MMDRTTKKKGGTSLRFWIADSKQKKQYICTFHAAFRLKTGYGLQI